MSKLDGLDPQFKLKVQQIIDKCKEHGINLVVTSGLRTIAEQDKLYDQGRTTPGEIVTKAKGGQSAHNYGLACFDSETYILTEHGWSLFKDLPKEVKVLTWNFEGELKYEIPIDYINYFYEGDMVSIKNRSVNILTTPNHKFAVKKCVKKKYGDWYDEIAENLDDSFKIPTAGSYFTTCITKDEVEYPYTKCDPDTWWEFMGWYLAEGSAMGVSDGIPRTNNSRFKVTISQYKEANYSTWLAIKDCLTRLGINFSYYGHDFIIHSKELWSILFPLGNSHQKRIPRYLLNAPPELLSKLLSSLVLGDGHFYGEAFGYYSVHKQLVEDVAELATLLGHSWHIGTKPIGIGKYPHSGEPFVTKEQFYLRSRNRKELELRHSSIKNKHITTVNYSGNVFCVSVPSGYVVLKRDDKVFIAGNCDLCPLDAKGNLWWNAPDDVWKVMHNIAEGEGFVGAEPTGLDSGYDWKFKDSPHIEDPRWKQVQADWKAGKVKIA